MSVWKKIASAGFLLGLLLTTSACVVAPTPGYPPSHMHASFWWYYPDYQVYYHSTDHYYYYYDGGVWIRSTTLPWRLSLHDKRRVRIDITGRPYARHSHHLRSYPPVRSNHRHRDDDRRYRPDDDRRHGPGDDHRHRPDNDVKEGKNIFRPHPKDRKYESRDEKYDDDRRYNKSREQRLRDKQEYKRDKFDDDRSYSNNKQERLNRELKRSKSPDDNSSRRKMKVEERDRVKNNEVKDKKKKPYDRSKGKAKKEDKRSGKQSEDSEEDEQDDNRPQKNQKIEKYFGR